MPAIKSTKSLQGKTSSAIGMESDVALVSSSASTPKPRMSLLLYRDLAAAGLLPDRHPDRGRDRSLPRDLAVRPRLVRLCLPADSLDRPVLVGRTQDRRRPWRPHPAGQWQVQYGQTLEEGRQARGMDRHQSGYRRRLGALLLRRADADA